MRGLVGFRTEGVVWGGNGGGWGLMGMQCGLDAEAHADSAGLF